MRRNACKQKPQDHREKTCQKGSLLTPSCAFWLGMNAAVVTPPLQACEFPLRKNRYETGLPLKAATENSFGGNVLGDTHSPSLG
jgi:hypothetical protein